MSRYYLVFRFVVAVFCAAFVSTSSVALAAEQEKSLQEETAEAIEAFKRYSAAQSEKAIAEANRLLERLDERIDQLQTRIDEQWDEMDEAAQRHTEDLLATLKEQRAELAEAYEQLKASSGNAWEAVKQGFLESYRSLRDTFDDAEEEADQGNAVDT